MLNIIGWIVVMFFALGWSLGMTKPYYATTTNLRIVIWWWIAIGMVFFTKISVFHLFYLMPIAAILSLLGIAFPAIPLTLVYCGLLYGVYYFLNA